MSEEVVGIVKGTMIFGEYDGVAYASVPELGGRYPEVVLLGSEKEIFQTYRGRRVVIAKDSIHFPDNFRKSKKIFDPTCGEFRKRTRGLLFRCRPRQESENFGPATQPAPRFPDEQNRFHSYPSPLLQCTV